MKAATPFVTSFLGTVGTPAALTYRTDYVPPRFARVATSPRSLIATPRSHRTAGPAGGYCDRCGQNCHPSFSPYCFLNSSRNDTVVDRSAIVHQRESRPVGPRRCTAPVEGGSPSPDRAGWLNRNSNESPRRRRPSAAQKDLQDRLDGSLRSQNC